MFSHINKLNYLSFTALTFTLALSNIVILDITAGGKLSKVIINELLLTQALYVFYANFNNRVLRKVEKARKSNQPKNFFISFNLIIAFVAFFIGICFTLGGLTRIFNPINEQSATGFTTVGLTLSFIAYINQKRTKQLKVKLKSI